MSVRDDALDDDELGDMVLQRGVEGDLYNPHPRIRTCAIAGCVPMGDPAGWYTTSDGAYHRRTDT